MVNQSNVGTATKDTQAMKKDARSLGKNLRLPRIGEVLLLALFVWCAPIGAHAQEPANGPTIVSQAWLPTQTIDGKFNEVMVVLELAPGAGVPPHTHGGAVLATVLDGEITLSENGTETKYTTGQSWTEEPGHVHEAFNDSSTPVRVVFTALLVGDAQALVPASDKTPSRPAPTILYQSALPDQTINGVFDEVMIVLDLAPGASIPAHTHGGAVLATVIDGEITLKEDSTEEVYKAGESWSEVPDHVHEAVNAGSKPVRVAFSVLLPVPAALTLVQ